MRFFTFERIIFLFCCFQKCLSLFSAAKSLCCYLIESVSKIKLKYIFYHNYRKWSNHDDNNRYKSHAEHIQEKNSLLPRSRHPAGYFLVLRAGVVRHVRAEGTQVALRHNPHFYQICLKKVKFNYWVDFLPFLFAELEESRVQPGRIFPATFLQKTMKIVLFLDFGFILPEWRTSAASLVTKRLRRLFLQQGPCEFFSSSC